MPVSFRDARSEEPRETAGYLRFVAEPTAAAFRPLFVINAYGEPVDFAFSRVDSPAHLLWRTGDSRRHAVASLCAVLFEAAPRAPTLLLALAEETPASLFVDDLLVETPVCRIRRDGPPRASDTPGEFPSDGVELHWATKPPLDGSPAQRLMQLLALRDLLFEPFERAAVGLEETFRGE